MTSGDPAWDEWLERIPRDVYHTAGFHSYSESPGDSAAFLAVAGDADRGLAWPYLLRHVSAVEGLGGVDATDVTSVYGYSGPLAWGCAPGDEFLTEAWTALVGIWHEQGVVATFTRFHPLLGNAAIMEPIAWGRDVEADPPPVAALGRTVSIDLTIDEDAIRSAYSESLRRQIRRYRRVGQTTIDDEDWTNLDAFTQLYHETMSRNDADEYYFFDADNFRLLRNSVHEHVHLLVTWVGDVIGAAGLFTEYRGIVQEHLVAADQALASVSPYKVLIDDAVAWAKRRGNYVLHLGGGRGAHEDSLFEFKRRFSERRHDFYTGRWILDRRAYADLVEARRIAVGDRGSLNPEYFPAYRAPLREQGPVQSSSD